MTDGRDEPTRRCLYPDTSAQQDTPRQTPRGSLLSYLTLPCWHDDTRFNLLLIGQPAPSAAGLRLGDVQIHAIPSDMENDAELAAASIPRPSYYLLRPDGHIGLAGTSFQEADVRHWLARSHLRLESGTPQTAMMAG